jgi:hypothetical protein
MVLQGGKKKFEKHTDVVGLGVKTIRKTSNAILILNICCGRKMVPNKSWNLKG